MTSIFSNQSEQTSYKTIAHYKSGWLNLQSSTIETSSPLGSSLTNDHASEFSVTAQSVFTQLHEKAQNSIGEDKQRFLRKEIKFIKGLETVVYQHTGTFSDYSQLTSKIKETLALLKPELLSDQIYRFDEDSAFVLDEEGNLSIGTTPERISTEEQSNLVKILKNEGVRVLGTEQEQEFIQKLRLVKKYASKNDLQTLRKEVKIFLKEHQKIAAIRTKIKQLLDLPFPKPDRSPDNILDKINNLEVAINATSPGLIKTLLTEKNKDLPAEFHKGTAAYYTALEKRNSHVQKLKEEKIELQNRFIAPRKKLFDPTPSLVQDSLLKAYQDQTKTLRDYKKGTKIYLDTSNDTLSYSYTTTYLNFKPQPVADKIDALVKGFETLLGSSAESVPHLLENEVLQLKSGLEAIIADYKKYPVITDIAQKGIERIHTKIEAIKQTHQAKAQEIVDSPNSTIWQIMDEYLTNVPKSVVEQLLTRSYGARLTQAVLNFYLESDATHLSRSQMIGLLAGIAVDVKEDDLKQFHDQSRPFEEVADTLLQRFRSTSQGVDLLTYFQVPLDFHKLTVENRFFNTHLKGDTTPAQNRRNALNVLADIQSIALYNPQRSLRLSKEGSDEILSKFISNTTKSNIFAEDYHLNYLIVSAAAIVLLEQYRKAPDQNREKVLTILTAVRKVIDTQEKLFPQESEKYAKEWKKLQTALENPGLDTENFIWLSMRHPRQSSHVTDEAFKEYAQDVRFSEFLARKVGYWNKYFLEEARYLNESKGTSEEYSQARVGTLVPIPTSQGPELYRVAGVQMVDGGFVCQILAPVNVHKYVEKEESIPVKMTFQGTIMNASSGARDFVRKDSRIPVMAALKGPGFELWEKEGNKLAIPLIKQIIAEIQSKHPEARFKLESTGHSLGASDTQNASAVLVETMASDAEFCNAIESIRLVPFNVAGCNDSSDAKLDQFLERIGYDKLDRIYLKLVMGDVVQDSGETKIGKRISEKHPEKVIVLESKNYLANDTLGKLVFDALDKHCDLALADRTKIIALRILSHMDAEEASRRNFKFIGIGNGATSFVGHADRLLSQHALTKGLLLAGKSATQLAAVTALRSLSEHAKKTDNVFIKIAGNMAEEYSKTRKKSAAEYMAKIPEGVSTQMLEGTDLDHIGY